MELLGSRDVVLGFVAICSFPHYLLHVFGQLQLKCLALGVYFAAINTKVDSPLRTCDWNTA